MSKKRNKFVIDRKSFLEGLYWEIQCLNPALLRYKHYKDIQKLDKISLDALWRIAEKLIEYYLTELDCDEDDVIVLKPFRGITLWGYDEYSKESVNNLTGEPYIRPARRRFRAFIDRYTRYVWNKMR